ncbi:MAG: peptidylprolyl isomerase [Candidatus Firestonebacteria bacterium]|nr:peptidylprolyl isomerase [Candidatus Firestonebacteria bacterium]
MTSKKCKHKIKSGKFIFFKKNKCITSDLKWIATDVECHNCNAQNLVLTHDCVHRDKCILSQGKFVTNDICNNCRVPALESAYNCIHFKTSIKKNNHEIITIPNCEINYNNEKKIDLKDLLEKCSDKCHFGKYTKYENKKEIENIGIREKITDKVKRIKLEVENNQFFRASIDWIRNNNKILFVATIGIIIIIALKQIFPPTSPQPPLFIIDRPLPNGKTNNSKPSNTAFSSFKIDIENRKPAVSKSDNKSNVVVLETNQGRIEIKLFMDKAPKTCENFIGLVKKGYYNGIAFHRVIKYFIIQSGDPTGTGIGGESIWGKPFKDEVTSSLQFDKKGLIAMANAGPNTNGSQFFITTVKTPWLNNMRHTIFGVVISGYDVVQKIENIQTGAMYRPKAEQKIVKAYMK